MTLDAKAAETAPTITTRTLTLVMATLTTWMNNVRVGTLTRQANGAHSFRYDEEWLRSPRARPLSLSLPLQYGNITADAVYHYFDNLLPDSPQVHLRAVDRQALSGALKQPFDLLAEVGRDSVGAVTLLPPGEEAHRITLADAGQAHTLLLTAYQSDIPLGMITSRTDFRISVAGPGENGAAADGRQWCIPAGRHADHAYRGAHRRDKAAMRRCRICAGVDNEYLCLALARELGLAVPEAGSPPRGSAPPGGNPLRPALGAGGTGAASAEDLCQAFWSSFSDEI